MPPADRWNLARVKTPARLSSPLTNGYGSDLGESPRTHSPELAVKKGTTCMAGGRPAY